MAEYLNPVDIANRALQHCGQPRIDLTQGFNENSKRAKECAFAYGKQRRFELRRNVWRFSTRWAVLRPVTDTSRDLAPALWSSSTTYAYGAVVSDAQGVLWQSMRHGNANNEPGKVYYWELYCGPLSIPAWVSGESYLAGDVIYKPGTDGTYLVFQSLVEGNEDDPEEPNDYDATRMYRPGDLVLYSGTVYQSVTDFNQGNTPDVNPLLWTTANKRGTGSEKWVQLNVELIDRPVVLPTPRDTSRARYQFRLPGNYLRSVIPNPKLGMHTPYGGPGYRLANDFLFEGNYFSSSLAQPQVFRFVADIQNVQEFDDMFCEGLAAKLALAIAPSVTQDDVDTGRIAAEYTKWMTEARIVNAIEIGVTMPAEDEYISVRY